MNSPAERVQERYLATLEIVRRELRVLEYSWKKLSHIKIDSEWVKSLDTDMDAAEDVEAFASRFGRLQDTIGDKLLPRALAVLLERPGSMLDNLNRGERLGWIDNAEQWASIRELRNRLIHEYMTDVQHFAGNLLAAIGYVPKLRDVYERFLEMANERFHVDENDLGKFV